MNWKRIHWGEGEIRLEDEEENEESDVDGKEGTADKESTVSSFKCVGPAISVQQDLDAASTALAINFLSKKRIQDNEDRIKKQTAMAILILYTQCIRR